MGAPTDRWVSIAELCYRIIVYRARDLTVGTANRPALVLAPHPDDETFGCAATIMRKRATGTRVIVCVVSDGAALPTDGLDRNELVQVREANLREACHRMGIPDSDLVLLGLPDSELGEHVDAMAGAIASLMIETEPEEVFIPSGLDWHPDHVAVHTAALLAASRAGSRASLYTYPIWFWSKSAWSPPTAGTMRRRLLLTRILLASALTLRPRTVRAEGYLDAKRDLMDVYSLELQPDFDFFARWHLRDKEVFFKVGPLWRRQT